MKGWLTLLIAGAALLSSLFVEATHNDRSNAERITALESHRTDDSSRLDRIEAKLDRVLERLTH